MAMCHWLQSMTPNLWTSVIDCSQWQKFMAKPAKKCHWLWSMTKKVSLTGCILYLASQYHTIFWLIGYVRQQRVNSINLRSHPARQSCHWAFFAYDGQAALSPSPANHVTSVLMGRPPGSKVDFTTFEQPSLDQMKQPGAAWILVMPLSAVQHCNWPRAARLYNKRKCVSWSIGRPPPLHQETRLPSWRRFTDTRHSKHQAVDSETQIQ